MMQLIDTDWSETEKKIANTALAKAKEREINALIEVVREQSTQIVELDDLWHLHDFLSARRFDIDGKYDSGNSTVIFALAGLVKEGWLHLDELDGLDKAKITKVSAMTRIV